MSNSLIPIRVDAWSADKSTRIVDTFLLDPILWPISSGRCEDPSILVEENTQYLADMLLLDAEVMGMGRTAVDNNSKFTGRLPLWNFSLQQRLCDQIRGQLWRVLTTTSGPRRELQKRKHRNSMDGVRPEDSQQQLQEEHDGMTGKRRADSSADSNDGNEERPLKRMRTESETGNAVKMSGSSSDKQMAEASNKEPDVKSDITVTTNLGHEASSGVPPSSQPLLAATNIATAPVDSTSESLPPLPMQTPSNAKPLATKNSQPQPPQLARDSIYASKMPLGNLIPIRIRLTAFGIRIHDDFYVDPVLDTSPLEIAQSIAKDLRLNDDLIVALAVDICEQMHGVHTNQQPILPAYDKEQGGGKSGSSEPKFITAAYKLEQRVHIANVAHLVHDYRA